MSSMQNGQSGFLATSDHNFGSLGLAVAVTGAGLAALLLAKPYVAAHFPLPLTVIDSIALPKPPDPRVIARPRLPTDPTPSPTPPAPRPDTSTAVTRDPGLVPDVAPLPPFDGLGSGTRPTIAPVDPPALPIMVAAQLDPRYARDRQPPYPANLQRAEIEGQVTVRVQIGTDGRVRQVEAVHADNDGFFKATRDWALKHWRFIPTTSDGVPIASWRTMSVTFTIDRQ